MFDFGAVFVITVATAAITHQVTKHGWGSFIDHDEANPKPKHQPKHAKPVYDWEHDSDFRKSLQERKSA